MKRAGVLLTAILVATACTRVIDAEPVAQGSVGPIAESQVRDLLSAQAQQRPVDVSVYEGVDPPECALLIQEANSPLIFDAKPVINDGGFWSDDDGNVIEFAGVYRTTYKPLNVIGRVHSAVDSCQGRTLLSDVDESSGARFRLLPPIDSGSPDIAVWSVVDRESVWACDNAFVAAYNAAVFITACGETGGFDVLKVAEGALERINRLANDIT